MWIHGVRFPPEWMIVKVYCNLRLSSWRQNSYSVSKVHVEVNKTGSQLSTNRLTLVTHDKNINTSTNTNTYKRPWFGHQCEISRKEYHRAKKRHAKYPSTASKACLVTTRKTYKRKLNFFIRKYNKDTQNKLRKLKYKLPKHFWKILNSLENKNNKENKDIRINDFYTFFQRPQWSKW